MQRPQGLINRATINRVPIDRRPINKAHIIRAPIDRDSANRAPIHRVPLDTAPINRVPIDQGPINRAPIKAKRTHVGTKQETQGMLKQEAHMPSKVAVKLEPSAETLTSTSKSLGPLDKFLVAKSESLEVKSSKRTFDSRRRPLRSNAEARPVGAVNKRRRRTALEAWETAHGEAAATVKE